MEMSPYVLRQECDDGIVYFNTKNNHSFLITKQLLEKLKTDEETKEQYKTYLEQFHYFPEDDEVNQSLRKIREIDDTLLEFTILTHGDCNFRCKYCYEKFENIAMSRETEDAILKFAEERLSTGKYKVFKVSWFGGEPLLGYRTIQYLSEKFKGICYRLNVEYLAIITTNGYLLSLNKLKKLVSEYKVIGYQITLDGDRNSHDCQRVLKNERGSYERIYKNLQAMKDSELDFFCTIRFNISKENLENVKSFLYEDGVYFKNDKRFGFAYHNVGNWGQGERSDKDCVTLLEYDASFELSQLAISLGYKTTLISHFLNNRFTCYANRTSHYMFNVRGLVQSCTVALYHHKNIFGNINKGYINHDRLRNWVIEVEENCKSCPFVLICKSGHCPMAKRISKHPSEVLCRSIQRVVERNLALFALTKSYHDILDVG
ncbi:radical SAM protein [Streptococcus suis]|uniref:radical SAM protein n=1 Tax=Streptococcus suis TaxID=1307 RepID=UPI002AAEF213|nr:radical SAM protein [Streptococcus suis]HEM5220508.1 radical SAM protein [Streptococcus suis]HEM5222830.1 radical SAM protein [Streptococcus suis]